MAFLTRRHDGAGVHREWLRAATHPHNDAFPDLIFLEIARLALGDPRPVIRRTLECRWEDVFGQFMVISVHDNNLVCYSVRGSGKPPGDLSGKMSSQTYSLPDTYGLKPRELADLLNDRLRAYRKGQSGKDAG